MPGRPDPNNPPLVVLRGPEHLDQWSLQTKNLARQLGCLTELQSCTVPFDETPAQTVDELLTRTRVDNANTIILSTISSPVYAHARILGYNTILGKNPTLLYRYVKWAASRMHIVHRGQQSDEEVNRMIVEYESLDEQFYPRQIRFQHVVEWLEKMIRRRYETGDTKTPRLLAVLDTISERETSRLRQEPVQEEKKEGAMTSRKRRRVDTPSETDGDTSQQGAVQQKDVQRKNVQKKDIQKNVDQKNVDQKKDVQKNDVQQSNVQHRNVHPGAAHNRDIQQRGAQERDNQLRNPQHKNVEQGGPALSSPRGIVRRRCPKRAGWSGGWDVDPDSTAKPSKSA
ncbi:hypothetical protein VTK73DRAFT_3201 [Phialemonium thermophilum]|uniref:Uncharacterized protein n=1 Tax=Phialemonium thermophilum TaxID=223376 RepID=A0ABR3WZX7_9PEZI